MLPILKPKKQQTGVIIQDRQLNEFPKEDEQNDLESCVKDLLVAFSFKDIKMIAQSIKDIHDVLHMEMDKLESNDFHSQNLKAHKEQE